MAPVDNMCMYVLRIPGRLDNGTDPAMIVNPPFWRPEDPIPATARRTINILEDEAMPQSKEPNSKTTKKARNVHWRGSADSLSKRRCDGEVLVYLGAEVSVEFPCQGLKRGADTCQPTPQRPDLET